MESKREIIADDYILTSAIKAMILTDKQNNQVMYSSADYLSKAITQIIGSIDDEKKNYSAFTRSNGSREIVSSLTPEKILRLMLMNILKLDLMAREYQYAQVLGTNKNLGDPTLKPEELKFIILNMLQSEYGFRIAECLVDKKNLNRIHILNCLSYLYVEEKMTHDMGNVMDSVNGKDISTSPYYTNVFFMPDLYNDNKIRKGRLK